MTDLDQDAETARNGHVGYTHAQADAEGKDWLRDHPPYCAGCAALDRILARMDETVIEHQRARITELEESTTFYKGAYITADKERNALVIERSNIANELKAYPDSDLVSLAKTYETARVAAEARITELEAEVERLREELKQEQVWFRDAARARNDLERDYAHLYDRLRGIEEAAQAVAFESNGEGPTTRINNKQFLALRTALEEKPMQRVALESWKESAAGHSGEEA